MKIMRAIFTSCLIMAVAACFGQRPHATLASLSSSVDRLNVVKNSIDIPLWHEKTFWPLYEKFIADDADVSASGYRAVYVLSRFNNTVSDNESEETVQHLFSKRYEELELQKKYYVEIGAGFNGVIALQFLQTETVMDLMETFRIYEESPFRNYRFQPSSISPENLTEAKLNTLTAALSLDGAQASQFKNVYTRYVAECGALLGEDYNIFSLYTGEPSDYTPALAKRLGYDLLHVMERELKLKEKYFIEMEKAVGPAIASGFLAWEDYYSVLAKMQVWAEPR